MTLAPARVCGSCGAVISRGRCRICRSQQQHQRVYGRRWRSFRQAFFYALYEADVHLACGAVLPDGPHTSDSRCRQAGRVTTTGLELDHEPPLLTHEYRDAAALCDERRVQVLCRDCHTAKTRRQTGAGFPMGGW